MSEAVRLDLLTLGPTLSRLEYTPLTPSSMNLKDNCSQQATEPTSRQPSASGTISQQQTGLLSTAATQAEDRGTVMEKVTQAGRSDESSAVGGGTNKTTEPTTYEGDAQLGAEAQDTPVSTTPPYLFTTPKKRLLSLSPFSAADMFSNEFMQSVADQLEDFDSNLFRPDGDINFERDFGQWFNDPAEPMPQPGMTASSSSTLLTTPYTP
ncbi:hypothetical protein VNI00_010659 [Paramarasmius palmivorus]|uniref:Uncharacterized protein n=1 Tax=Paramarasmius palmivorus TaxID=297713 RepID=A0AAW0CK84_9AGAR